jgi:MFS family permease
VPVLIFVGAVVVVISSLGVPLVPAIAESSDVPLPDAQWSLTITLLVGAVSTPVMGRLGDGPHRRRVVLGVLGLVVVGGVLAALPLGLGWLLAGRALQGFGLGLGPVLIAIARDALPPERSRGTIVALALTVVAGLGLGYPLAGLVADLGGVSAAFWTGAVISAAAMAAAAAVLPRAPSRPSRRFDAAGALLLAAGLGSGLLALSEGAAWGWTSPRLLLTALGSVVAVGGWVVVELRVREPLVDLRLARGRLPATAHTAGFLIGLANYLLLASVPLLAQTPASSGYGFGASIVVAGLVLLPFSAAGVLSGRLARWLADRIGTHLVLPVSALVLAAALAGFGLARTELWQLFAIMAVAGLAVGGAFAALPGLIVAAVPAGETGSAIGLNQVLRYAGFATGSALTATVLEMATPAGEVLPRSGGYTAVALIGCGICLATALLTWLLTHRSRSRTDGPVTGGGPHGTADTPLP